MNESPTEFARTGGVGRRLAVGFGSLLALLIGLAAMTLWTSQSVESRGETAREAARFAGMARDMKLEVVQIQQWLTDISATRALDGLDDGYDEAQKNHATFMAHAAEFQTLYERNGDSEAAAQMKSLTDAVDAYYVVGKKMAAAYIAEGPAGGNKIMGEFDGTAERLTGLLGPFLEAEIGALDGALDATSGRGLQPSQSSAGHHPLGAAGGAGGRLAHHAVHPGPDHDGPGAVEGRGAG
jgi:hypothetical protein